MVSSAAKRARKKKLAHERQDRELLRPTRQMDPADLTDPEMEQADDEIRFAPRGQSVEQMPATPATVQADTKCEYLDIVNMIKTLNGAIAAISRDTASIQRAYEQLRSENVARDKALTDLSEIVREYGITPTHGRPQPGLREDVMDRDGNLRGADIGITWEDNETFLHGVRVVGPDPSRRPGMRPAMSTPHQPMGGRDRDDFPSTVHQQTQPELKKYLWVVIRTQKDKKLQTLIEVCTDFSSLATSSHLHRPAEQTFAVHQQRETPYLEDDYDSEEVFAVGDRPSWTNRRPPETSGVPTLQQMFALAQRMGYEMRPISRQTDAPRQQPGGRSPVGQERGFRSQPRPGRDYSKFRCFSCGQFGHMQSRCPKPDASLPYKPAGWFLQSEGNGQRDGRNQTENSP